MSQNCVILYDNPTIKKLTITIMLLPSCRAIISQVFREVHIEHNVELYTVKTNKSISFKRYLDRLKDKRQDHIDIRF